LWNFDPKESFEDALFEMNFNRINRFVTNSINLFQLFSLAGVCLVLSYQRNLKSFTHRLRERYIRVPDKPTASDFRIFCEPSSTDCHRNNIVTDACALYGAVLRDNSMKIEVPTASGSIPANLLDCIPSEKFTLVPRPVELVAEDSCVVTGTTILIVNYQQHIPHFSEGLFFALAGLLEGNSSWMCSSGYPCRFLFHSIVHWPERTNIVWQQAALEIAHVAVPQRPTTLNVDLFNVAGAARSMELTGCNSGQLVFERLILQTPRLHRQWFNANPRACTSFRDTALKTNGFLDRVYNTNEIKIAFLIRRKSRYVINSHEIVKALEDRFGGKVRQISFEGLSFSEQVAAMSDVRLFVTPHGAGVTNVVFMPPRSALIEIFPLYHRPHNYFDELARSCGIWYGAYENTNSSAAILEESCKNEFKDGLPPLDLCKSREHCAQCGKNSATIVDIQRIDQIFASAQEYFRDNLKA